MSENSAPRSRTGGADPTELPGLLRPAIEAALDKGGNQADIPADLHSALRDAGAFRMLTPLELGGSETPLTTVLEVYEEFGRIDPSVGWLVWNANFGFVAALLDESGAARIWGGSEPTLANSGMPGTAVEVDGGFSVSGHWRIVSGIHAADWLVAVVIVIENGAPRMIGGAPDVRLCVLHRDQWSVRDTWDVSGMRASGSNDVVVEDAFVPTDLVAGLDRKPRFDRPLYRGFIPALVFPGCTAVVLGTARAAVDATVELVREKKGFGGAALAEAPRIQYAVADAEADLRAARLLLYSAVGELEAAAEQGAAVTLEQRAALRAAMTHAAQVSRKVLVTMYELGSSTSVYIGNPLERYFRDGMVALQHANHSAQFLEAAGRVRLGMDPGMPLF